MSINKISTEKWDVNLLGDDFSGLNEVYREIADEIGIEKTIIIFNLFHGTQISFPNRLFSKEYTHKAIIKEYNGKNVPQLAQKYNYSERSIWRIIKAGK
jgi:Mor family transcriptional regulator